MFFKSNEGFIIMQKYTKSTKSLCVYYIIHWHVFIYAFLSVLQRLAHTDVIYQDTSITKLFSIHN